jgi:surface carbohydrate biosynthesis protein
MNNDPEYLIFVEHVARELDIACLIKYLIEQKNGRVAIVSLPYFNEREIKKNNLKVVLVPYCIILGPTYQSILPRFSNISIINLAYEQLLATITENMKAPKDEFAKKNVIHHAWSKQYYAFLQKYGVTETNIHINGNLSYALYKEPYKDFFISRDELAKEHNLDPLKKWVFIPENYAAAFWSDAAMTEKLTLGMDPKDQMEYHDFTVKSLREVIRWCSKLSKSENVEIIFRPRPATSIERMTAFFTDVIPSFPKHLHIIKSHTVREWILASNIVVSSYSTTLIEAAIADKPVAMLSPYPIPDFLYVSWYDMVQKLDNYASFCQQVSSPDATSGNDLKIWAESEMMSNGDPILGIVNLSLSLADHGPRIPDIILQKMNNTSPLNTIYKKIYKLSAEIPIYIRLKKPCIEGYENDNFSMLDVEQRVTRWERILHKKKQ